MLSMSVLDKQLSFLMFDIISLAAFHFNFSSLRFRKIHSSYFDTQIAY